MKLVPFILPLLMISGCASQKPIAPPIGKPVTRQLASSAIVTPSPTATITLIQVSANFIWIPNDANAVSYNLYYGPESRTYLNTVSAVDTNAVLNLSPLQAYYLAVTAVSSDGTESDFSDEIVYQPPPQMIQLHFPEPATGIQFSTDLVNWVDLPDARQTNGDWFVTAP